jgi:hypothetical protein
MNFQSPLLLDLRPALFEFFLHFAPHFQRLSLEPSDFNFSRFFELIESVFALDNRCLGHQESQLIESRERLVPTPASLDLDSSQHRSIGPFEHKFRIRHCIIKLRGVHNAGQ